MSQKSLIFWELGSLLQLAIFIFFAVVSSVIVKAQYSTRLHISHSEFSQQLLVKFPSHYYKWCISTFI